MAISIPELGVLPYYLSEAMSYATLGGAGFLAWRVVRAYERRGVDARRLRALARRVHRLEAAVGRVDRRVGRACDAQRFTTALLLGRRTPRAPRSGWAGDRAADPPPDSTVT